MEGQYSQWLGINHGYFENRFCEVEPFINCYRVFSGVAGKCANCYAEPLCKELNESFFEFARKEIELKEKGSQPECLLRQRSEAER